RGGILLVAPGEVAGAGDVAQDVDAAERGDRVGHRLLAPRRAGHVARDRVRGAAGVLDAGRRHVGALDVETGNGGTFSREQLGRRLADAAAGAGDDGLAAGEAGHEAAPVP